MTSTDHEEVTSSIQDKENLKDRVESNLEELRKILNKTIISIKGSDLDTRASWISELDDLYKTSFVAANHHDVPLCALRNPDVIVTSRLTWQPHETRQERYEQFP